MRERPGFDFRGRPLPTAALPDKPSDVGCPPSCGLYRPNVYACTPCYLLATGQTVD